MNLLRLRLRTACTATLALLFAAAMAAPLATALESTDTTLVDDTEETTTETTEDTTTVLDEPSPSPTDDGTLDATVDDTTGTVDGTVDTVEDSSEELVTTAEGVVSPSEEPSDEPSEDDGSSDDGEDERDEDPAGDDGTSEGSTSDGTEADSTQDGTSGSQQDRRAAGSSTREADRPSGSAEQREARLRRAAAVLARWERSVSPQTIDAMRGDPYEGGAAWSVPTRPVDGIDPATVFARGPDLSAPVFGGVQAYDRSPGQRSTHDVLSRLADAGADLATAARVLAPFPVVGPATYGDDWHAARDGGARLHKGTDIFAPRGTPVVASADGVIGRIGVNSGLGGNTIGLFADDGTYFYYAHLDAFAEHVRFNLRVAKGEIIGFVGDSGNAVGTPPHLHFQIHPDNGAPVPPVTHLDRWLEEARAKVLLVRDTSGVSGNLPVLVAPPAGEAAVAPDVAADGSKPDAGPAAASGAVGEQVATRPTGYTRGEDSSQSIAVFIALTGVGWYLLRRRTVFAGAGLSDGPERVVVPDVLEPVLTVEDVVRAGERGRVPGRRDVLEPMLDARGAWPDDRPEDRSDERAGRDVLADILS